MAEDPKKTPPVPGAPDAPPPDAPPPDAPPPAPEPKEEKGAPPPAPEPDVPNPVDDPTRPAQPPKPAEGPPPEAPPLPASVKVDVDALAPVTPERRKPYWCGTMPGCPIQNVTVGGYDFPLFEGVVSFDVDGRAQGRYDTGKLHYLTDDDVERIKKGVADRVLRRVGDTAHLVVRSGKGFLREPRDEPIGRYLFMVPVQPKMPWGWRGATPDPMVA